MAQRGNGYDLRILVERLVPFDSLVDVSYGNVFCPFHEDPKRSKSKSAKFFWDDDGIIRLYCWGEHRRFTSYDYIKLKLEEDPRTYLINKYSEEEVNKYLGILHELGNEKRLIQEENKIQMIEEEWVDSIEDLNSFLDNIYVGFKLEEI